MDAGMSLLDRYVGAWLRHALASVPVEIGAGGA
jgi:hypothetical protein